MDSNPCRDAPNPYLPVSDTVQATSRRRSAPRALGSGMLRQLQPSSQLMRRCLHGAHLQCHVLAGGVEMAKGPCHTFLGCCWNHQRQQHISNAERQSDKRGGLRWTAANTPHGNHPGPQVSDGICAHREAAIGERRPRGD
jgi:hypothetical protein